VIVSLAIPVGNLLISTELWAGTRFEGKALAAGYTATEDQTMAKESKSTQSDVKRAMHKRKEGTLKSGRSGKTVKSKKQAIAIGLSEARAKGKKVPAKKAS